MCFDPNAPPEFKAANSLVASILQRCDDLRARCAPPRPPPPCHPGSAHAAPTGAPQPASGGHTFVTLRTSLNFRQPPCTGDGGRAGPASTASPLPPPPPPPPRPQTAPHPAAIDLNPGRAFPQGSPQRVAAAAPTVAGVLARLEQLRADVGRADLGRLTHREALQVRTALPR
jgi:hypothetical protein